MHIDRDDSGVRDDDREDLAKVLFEQAHAIALEDARHVDDLRRLAEEVADG